MIYLLDSNVWVVMLRRSPSIVETHFQATNRADIRICPMVMAELRDGCLRSAKPTVNRAIVDALIGPCLILPFDDFAVDHFVDIRIHLEKLGQVATFIVLATLLFPHQEGPGFASLSPRFTDQPFTRNGRNDEHGPRPHLPLQ